MERLLHFRPAAAAIDADIVMLCLLDGAAVEHVVFGPLGIASVKEPRILVDHSSISPAATRDFARRGRDGRLRYIFGGVSNLEEVPQMLTHLRERLGLY